MELADLSQRADETVRLNAWRGVFERTNRIITGRPISVKVVQNIPINMRDVSGWSDGEKIYFNGILLLKMLKSQDTVSAVLRLKGLNYHELSHILFTPRRSDELPKRIMEKQKSTGDARWWYSFNALEDQRIESMFTSTYGPSRRYFEAMILEWVVVNGTAECAILTYGRKYLPARIRVQAGRVFVKKYDSDLYEEFKKVIDGYSGLVFPRDSVKGLMLVGQFRDLLHKMENMSYSSLPTLPIADNGVAETGSGTSQGGPIYAGGIDRRMATEAKDNATRQAAEAEEAEAKAEAEIDREADATSKGVAEGGTGNEGTAEDAGQGKGKAGAETGGEKNADGEAQGGTEHDASGGTEGNGGGNAAGATGTGEHNVMTDDELAEAMRKLVEEATESVDAIRADEQIVEDTRSILDAVLSEIDSRKAVAEGVGARINSTLTPTSEALLTVRKIVRILQRIQQESEPTIQHRQYNGRVDIRRVINARPGEFDIFRAYESGSEDETSMESVILMDVSGSMVREAAAASEAIWVLKRAFDKLDIRTTVLVYDTKHYVLYQPNDRVPSRIQVVSTAGGTDPSSALEQAFLLLSQSHRNNKVLVTVTDGSWGGRSEDEAEMFIKLMNEAGVVTLLLGLERAVEQNGAHQHMLSADINSVSALPKAVLAVVERIIRTVTGNI